MKKICVFLGSAKGNHPKYINAAKELGVFMAKNNYKLVFGGSSIGLMGILADAVLDNNGKVEGFAVKEFEKVLHPRVEKMQIFNNMAERKMAEINYSDAFIAFPGGLGTLDELFEVWTLAKAKQTQKPIGLLNVDHIFTPLYDAVKTLANAGFLTQEQLELATISNTPESLFYKLFPPVIHNIVLPGTQSIKSTLAINQDAVIITQQSHNKLTANLPPKFS